MTFDKDHTLDSIVCTLIPNVLERYRKDCVPPFTLAAAMVDPQLVYCDEGPYEVEEGLHAFRVLVEQRVLDDADDSYASIDKMASIMSALSAMRSKSGELFRRPDMKQLAIKDVTGFGIGLAQILKPSCCET